MSRFGKSPARPAISVLSAWKSLGGPSSAILAVPCLFQCPNHNRRTEPEMEQKFHLE
jgi:hypothetical protein